ncbi:MAG TPA: cupin-like domain-containing protein, partial [Tahibacter sp.]|nr:cupin-like domain-containing protein [Tahibacter sp.]
MSDTASLRGIAHIDLPDAARFFAEYAWPSVPVLIRGIAERWGPLAQWEPRRLAGRIRDEPMPVSISEGVYDFNPHTDNWLPRETIVQMPVRELVRRIETRASARECLYLNQQSIPRRLPELMAQMTLPPLVPDGSIQDVFLWLGSQGNISSLHFDQPNNFFVQLHGVKRFRLFAPHDYDNLYPSATIGHFSRVNIEAPDLAAYPRYANARGVEVTVNAGDTLYLPPFWWHQVYSDTTSVSVSVFWRAYTHQLAAPAFVRGLPALYPKLAQKYRTYLPGRLPELVDFAGYLRDAG